MMRRSSLTVVLLVVFVAGLLIVLSSVPLGSGAANAYLRAQGGGMDTAQFVIVFQEYISAYRWIGSILAVVSGFGLVKAAGVL